MSEQEVERINLTNFKGNGLEAYEIMKRKSSKKVAKEEMKKLILNRFEKHSPDDLKFFGTYELAKEIFSEKEYQSLENFAKLFQGKAYFYIDFLKDVEDGILPVKDVAKGVVKNGTRGYWTRLTGPFEMIYYKVFGILDRHRL